MGSELMRTIVGGVLILDLTLGALMLLYWIHLAGTQFIERRRKRSGGPAMSATHDDSAEKEVARLQRENGALRSQLAEAQTAVREALGTSEPLALLLAMSDKPMSNAEILSAVQFINRTLRPFPAKPDAARSTPERGKETNNG
jgi:hypothetical protein